MKNTELYTVLIIILLAFSGFFSNFEGITGNQIVSTPRLVLHTPSAANAYSTCPSGYVGKASLSQVTKIVNVCVLSGSTFLTTGSSSTSHPIGANCQIGYVLAGSVSSTQRTPGEVIFTGYFCSTKVNNQQELIMMDITNAYGYVDTTKTCPSGYRNSGYVTSKGSVTAGGSYIGIRYIQFCVRDVAITAPVAGTCTDGIKNQDETDIDCGGAICQKCGGGKTCYITADCTSGTCYGGICGTPGGTCVDNIRNQDETDVDCGGLICNACVIGKTCSLNRDCLAGSVCTTTSAPLTVSTPWGSVTQNITSSTCTATTGGSCTDGIKNQAETDIDCGGNVCSACTIGRTCSVNTDCVSGASCFNGVCTSTTAPSPQIVACASTATQNATLGDLDGNGIVNLFDAELLAKVFYPQTGIYVPSCFNKIKDGSEQDIDCGGSCGNICPSLTTSVQSGFCITLFGKTICAGQTTINSPPMYCCQDLNSDGVVNTTDVNKIVEIASGIKPSAGRCSAGNPIYPISAPIYPSLSCNNNQRVGDLSNDSTINILDYYLLNAIRQGAINVANQNCCNDWSNDGLRDYIGDINLNGFLEFGDEASIIPPALGYTAAPANFCSTQITTTVTPPAANCNDNLRNQDETDIDCGGSICNACQIGGNCNINSDCSSTLVCTNGVCSSTNTTTTPPAPSSGGGGGGGGGRAGAGGFICSNGRLDVGEECDDGNIFSDDGCDKDCNIEYCGDGVIQYGLKEQCDPADGLICGLGCTLISQVPKPVQTIPTYTEPVYVPEYQPVIQQPSRLPKIIGTIITISILTAAVTYLLRKRSKAKSQQQPFSLPLRYSRGSR